MGPPYIEFALETLLLNEIWTTGMVYKHVSTGYSSTDVVQGSLFLQKNALQHKALNQVHSIVIAN